MTMIAGNGPLPSGVYAMALTVSPSLLKVTSLGVAANEGTAISSAAQKIGMDFMCTPGKALSVSF